MLKKLSLFCLAALAAVLLGAAMVNALVIALAKPHILDDAPIESTYDCILVPGCLVYGDTPSAMLRDRLDRAIELYNAGVSDRLLMSGDHGREDYDEVTAMKLYAMKKGVPEEAIVLDHAGFSTYESAYRARDVFCAEHPLIVTQTYHLYRAVYDARQLGLDADGASAVANTYVFQKYNDAREFLARCKDFLFSIVRPKPTYLGEPIPLHGCVTSKAPAADG